MQLATTFRRMDASQAVRDYASDRLEKIRKYLHRAPMAAHAVFSVERNHQHTVELSIKLPNGLVLQARETTEDMYSSIDLAGGRIERQVRKWKDKIRDHKPHGGPHLTARERVLPAKSLEPRPPPAPAAPKKPVKPAVPAAPTINVVKEETFTVRALRVEDAVMQMNLVDGDFLVFRNIDTGGVSVVYRRKDGNYGLIET